MTYIRHLYIEQLLLLSKNGTLLLLHYIMLLMLAAVYKSSAGGMCSCPCHCLLCRRPSFVFRVHFYIRSVTSDRDSAIYITCAFTTCLTQRPMSTSPLPAPRTPPPSALPPYVGSSRQQNYQVFCRPQTRGFTDPQPFPSLTTFLKFLTFKKALYRVPDTTPTLSMDTFIAAANVAAAAIQKDREYHLVYLSFQLTHDLHSRFY